MNANKTSETRYDWTQAPWWAKYAATDSEGDPWWYETLPERDHEGWYSGSDDYRDERMLCLDWRDSLEPRPTLIAEAPESPVREGVTDDEVWQACSDYTNTYDGAPDSDMRPVMRHILERFLAARSQP